MIDEVIMRVYMGSALIGAVSIVVSVYGGGLRGALRGGGHGHAGHPGHGGRVGGHGGHVGGHGGHAGGGHGGHAGGGQHGSGGTNGHAGVGDTSHPAHGHHGGAGKVQVTTSSLYHVPHIHKISMFERILNLLNPMSISIFLCFFGMCGLLLGETAPMLGHVTLLPSIVIGWLSANMYFRLMHFLSSRMQASSTVRVQDLIGHMAIVIIPIEPGHIGQIEYVSQSKRQTSAAKALSPEVSYEKGTRVMIADLGEYFLYVEPWTETFIEPGME